jgi:hypothetical protein
MTPYYTIFMKIVGLNFYQCMRIDFVFSDLGSRFSDRLRGPLAILSLPV